MNFLAVWGEVGADRRRRDASRRAALGDAARDDGDAVGKWLSARLAAPAAPAPGETPPPRDADAIRAVMLRLRHDQRQQFLRALSDAQAKHHETVMLIIRNIAPAGRYEYNPATGRYDRYVPNP